MREHPFHGPAVPQLRAVGQGGGEMVTGLREAQHQVELGGPASEPQRLHLHPAQAQRGARGARQRQYRLEERGVAEAALHAQLLHESLEGKLLVEIGVQRRFAHPGQEHPARGRAGQVGAQDQHVDEEADQSLRLRSRPSRDRAPHHHVLLSGIAPQQRLPGREKRHEQRRSLAAGEYPHAPRDLRREHDLAAGAALAVRRGAGPVDGDLQQRRRPGQLRPPVGELRLQHLPAQPAPLPRRVVRVLHRQLRQLRLPSLRVRPVQLRHLPHQHLHAPPVADDVVQREEQHVILLARAAAARARSNGPRPRSNGRSASSAARRRASSSGTPPRSITGSATAPAAWITCTGSPPSSANVVRSVSCRRTSASSVRRSASTSSAPRSRSACGTL